MKIKKKEKKKPQGLIYWNNFDFVTYLIHYQSDFRETRGFFGNNLLSHTRRVTQKTVKTVL